MIVIDAHLDLSWNVLNWNRDLTLTVPEIRQLEAGLSERNRATSTAAFPEMRRAEVAVCFATLLARATDLNKDKLDYGSQEIASAIAQGQLAYYRIEESKEQVRMVKDWPSLEAQVQDWNRTDKDSDPNRIHSQYGGRGYDPFTGSGDRLVEAGPESGRPGSLRRKRVRSRRGLARGLTSLGRDLLRLIDELGMILDVTHLADESFWAGGRTLHGPVLASQDPRSYATKSIPGG